MIEHMFDIAAFSTLDPQADDAALPDRPQSFSVPICSSALEVCEYPPIPTHIAA